MQRRLPTPWPGQHCCAICTPLPVKPVYFTRSRPQWLYFAVVIVALDYLHDSWFYWTHRLLHWRPLYMHVHLMHHR